MSAPPPGYNASESMLSGGTEQIVPVMGGGKKRTKKRQKGGKGNPFTLRKRDAPPKPQSANVIQHITDNDVTIDDASTVIKTPLPTDVLNSYIKEQENLWVRRGSGAGATKYITLQLAKFSGVTYNSDSGNLGQGGYDRLGIILPKSTTDILLVPPVHGNMAVYSVYKEKISELISLQSTTAVVIFTPPFYAACSDIHVSNTTKSYSDNAAIFRDFVAWKMDPAVKASIHILTEYTTNSIASGISVTVAMNAGTSHIVTMLEPSYIIYPHQCNIDAKTHSGIVFSAAATNEPYVPASSTQNKFGMLTAAQNGFSSVAYPPNIKTPDQVLTKLKIPYMTYAFTDTSLINTTDNTFHIFNTGDGSLKGVIAAKLSKESFIIAPDAFVNNVSYSNLSLGGIEYSIRQPENDVIEDWKELKFTQDEVKFLNALQISPLVLTAIYGDKPWNEELALNMATIVRSNCFDESKLVLHSQCQDSQKFIAKILKYFLDNNDTILRMEANEEKSLNLSTAPRVDISGVTVKAPSKPKKAIDDPFTDKSICLQKKGWISSNYYNNGKCLVPYSGHPTTADPVEDIENQSYARYLSITYPDGTNKNAAIRIPYSDDYTLASIKLPMIEIYSSLTSKYGPLGFKFNVNM